MAFKKAFYLNSRWLREGFYTINLINFPSRTNISRFRNTTAQICEVPTGCPSLRRCNRRRLICSASASAVIPQPSVESSHTMASSILIRFLGFTRQIYKASLSTSVTRHFSFCRTSFLRMPPAPAYGARWSGAVHEGF